MGWIVVGLSGVTNGGKTSVALKLKEILPNSVHMKQDDYFHPIEDPRHVWVNELRHINWELLSSLNNEKLVCDIKDIIKVEPQTRKYLLLDGFLIFNHPELLSLCNYKFYFDLDYGTCKERRLTRSYEPPDVPGYFDKIVWPEAVKSRRDVIETVKDIILIDGSQSVEKLLDIVLKHLNINK